MNDKKRRKSCNKETLGIYWRHAKVYRTQLWVSALSVLVIIGVETYIPLLLKYLFDLLATAATDRNEIIWDGIRRTLFFIAILMSVTLVAWSAFFLMLNQFESRTMRDLANSCFAHLQNHSTRFFADNFAGALTTRVNRFVASFEFIADQFLIFLGQTVIRVILILGTLCWYNWDIGMIFLVWTIVLVVFNFLFARYRLKYDLAKSEADTNVTARLADTIANTINLKLFASTTREVEEFQEITEKLRQARAKTWSLGLAYETIQRIAVRTLNLGMLATSIYYWWNGRLTFGDLVMLRAYFDQLTEHVWALGKNIRTIYESMANANEMTEILLAPHEIVDYPDAVPLEIENGAVEFRNVQFSYSEENRLVLKDFSLTLKPGEKVGVVGPSGGGKSTLLKILARLYNVLGGQILIDRQDIALVTQDSLHRAIAFVPQDPALFHRSIMENIRYSRPLATDEEVIRAAKLAHCHEFVSLFPQGYGTLVGERGVKLSGGERQRVAIARAILMNAPILVLDEATSSLDSESEAYIQDSLSKIMPGRTVIAVAHRLSTIKKMDRIVVVDNGRIIEEGKHDILLEAQNGLYQRLWNLQAEPSIH